MNRPKLYHRTVGILYNAYFKDTLQHGDCCACAVGNIVASNMNYKIIFSEKGYRRGTWMNQKGEELDYPGVAIYKDVPFGPIPRTYNGWGAFVATSAGTQGIDWECLNEPKVAEQVKATGYTPHEIILIEAAFESARGYGFEARMFDGLCKVLDALEAIHKVHHQETIDQKKHFSGHYQTRVYAGKSTVCSR